MRRQTGKDLRSLALGVLRLRVVAPLVRQMAGISFVFLLLFGQPRSRGPARVVKRAVSQGFRTC